jgi:hypothetical protein
MISESWRENMRGKVVLDVVVVNPSFFKHGYIKFLVEDPITKDKFTSKINIG